MPVPSRESGRFCEPFESFMDSDCDDCKACGFFDAGPLLTPGLRPVPVWVFGEFEPLPLELELDEC